MGDNLDLDALKALIPTVYRGPWYVEYDEATGQWLVGYPTDNPLAGLVATVPDYGERVAAFIAAARTAVPALIAEVERLRGERAKPREWAVRHPGIGVLPYDSETDARTAAGTAGTVLHLGTDALGSQP